MKEGKGGKKWQGKAMKGWIKRRDGGGGKKGGIGWTGGRRVVRK